MKLNLDDYKHFRPLVKNMLRLKGTDYRLHASQFSCSAGCPIFATYYFIGEEIGFNEFIVSRLYSYSKFYGYTKIILDKQLILVDNL